MQEATKLTGECMTVCTHILVLTRAVTYTGDSECSTDTTSFLGVLQTSHAQSFVTAKQSSAKFLLHLTESCHLTQAAVIHVYTLYASRIVSDIIMYVGYRLYSGGSLARASFWQFGEIEDRYMYVNISIV